MRTATVPDLTPAAAPLPHTRVCRRCGKRVLETQTETFGVVIRLDPTPTPDGAYRLTAAGLAQAIGRDPARGELCHANHETTCTSPKACCRS